MAFSGRRLHAIWGAAVVLVFLATGLFMRRHDPPLDTLDPGVRMLFRSRHVYLLLTGLINLTLGSGLSFRPAGLARRVQIAGSGLLFASPGVVFAAFCLEPAGAGIASPLTPLAIAMTLVGVLLHFLASPPWRP